MTDWDAIQAGDLAPPRGGSFCGARSEPMGPDRRSFICCRPAHTTGQHVAPGFTCVLAVWNDRGRLAVALEPTDSREMR